MTSLAEVIKDQKNDPGLENGRAIVAQMPADEKKNAYGVSALVGSDIVAALRNFSKDGPVGRALARSAPAVAGNSLVTLPSMGNLHKEPDTELLLAALFDPNFQKALYQFQLILSRSNLEEQQGLVRRFASINWSKFNAEDQNWLQKALNLISASQERKRAWDLNLRDVIPLMKIPSVLDMVTVSASYARMMDAAMSAYLEHKEFLLQMGNDNDELLREIDALLDRIKNAEAGRLARLEDVVSSTESLRKLMETANLIADLTNRSVEAEAQKKAGEQLATALKRHSQDTLEAQEAYLEQFMRLNQILVSNQVREGRLQSAMAALNLYVKSYQAFVLILTSLQVYLLTASAALKKYMADSLEGANRQLVTQIYSANIEPLKASISKYSQGFSRIPSGQSVRSRTLDTVAN